MDNSPAYELGRMIGTISCVVILLAVVAGVVVLIVRAQRGGGQPTYPQMNEQAARNLAINWFVAVYRAQPAHAQAFFDPYMGWMVDLWGQGQQQPLRVAVDQLGQVRPLNG